jgi:hypothetical protein
MQGRNGRAWRIACALGIAAIATSGAAAAGAPQVSVSVSPPSISGDPVVGEPLHASHGSWSGSPTSYEDWWERCTTQCVIIPGASALDYTPTKADVGAVVGFGEIAFNSAGQSKPAYASYTQTVMATPPIHFTVVGPTGIPQFAYFLVEPSGHRPKARDWHLRTNPHTDPVGHAEADVRPGQTIYFNATGMVGLSWGGVAHLLSPEGVTGKPFHVTASTPSNVRIVLPSPARPYHPELSKAERYVLGQLNRKRERFHAPPLKVSTILDKVASVAARDEAVNGRWPDPYFFSLAPAFGWPGDLTESGVTLIDAPLSRPDQVLAHWDGAYSGESTGLWNEIRAPYNKYVGIADGGGAWNIVLVTSCPATVNSGHTCGLTNITGS